MIKLINDRTVIILIDKYIENGFLENKISSFQV